MPVETDGRLARLTARAVGRAAALSAYAGPDALAAFCYRAGATAAHPRTDARWARVLVDRATRSHRTALAAYRRSRTEHWDGWTAHDADPAVLVHKVYVSPTTPAVPVALERVVAVATFLGVPSWKVGADTAGLHRADKVVLYLPSAQRADAVAQALADELADLPAQGVLFSGQVGASGIVSRGQDHDGQSWRAMVCRAVALALADARAADQSATSQRVAADALSSLAADLDVVTWYPGARVAA